MICALITVGTVLATLLLLPLRLLARGAAGDEELEGLAELRWGPSILSLTLASGLGLRVRLLGIPVYRRRTLGSEGDAAESRGSKEDERDERKRGSRERGWSERALGILRDRREIASMGGQALRALHPRIRVAGTVGFDNPGFTAAAVVAVRELSRVLPDRIELELQEDFLEESLQLWARMSAWVVPAQLVWIGVVWLLRADTRRVLLASRWRLERGR
ncbi:MAG: hypothetical protein OEY14_00150 [Myxococcales bacterium]|nr:hypothetical protein [Myxococcales bacterium]